MMTSRLLLGLLVIGAAWAQGQMPGQGLTRDPLRVVAGEAGLIQLKDVRLGEVLSVRSTPQLAFPIRIDLPESGGPLRFSVPPATPPGEYHLQIDSRSPEGLAIYSTLIITVRAVSVAKSATGRPPVILLNGFQLICTDTGSAVADSVGTFGQMAALLEDELAPVLFFNNCAYGDVSIEQLAGQLNSYISSLIYTDGTPVTQVDVVAHSMGGLIARAYLAGIQPGDRSFLPPLNPRVRKAVFIATPNFGSFQALYIGTQESEMVLGGPLLWDLATWNQRGDDLRGVDAISVIGNAGTEGGLSGAADGVVSLSSASLNFTAADQRTRIVPYCHIPPDLITSFGLGMSCDSPNKGIANIDTASHMTFQIVDSFLAGTATWQSIGHPPSADTSGYLSQYGGLVFEDSSASDAQIPLSQAAFGTDSLQSSLSSDGLFYSEFLKGSGNLTSSTAGATSCGPFTEPAGYYSAIRCKPGPQISAVRPLATSSPGLVVASGGAITVTGVGFGTRCSTCQVLAYPGPTALSVTSWSDSSISAVLPSSFSGFAQIVVQAAAGQDYISIMASPGVTTSPVTFQTSPTGLQFSVDGASPLTAPQTLTLSSGAHTISIATPQPGVAGTQYAFSSWSDGGAASHSIAVSGAATYTATFQTQYRLTLSASPSTGGVVTPASGTFYNSGSVVPVIAVANGGYAFTGWTGSVSNPSAASTTVTMGSPQTIVASFASSAPTINPGGVVPLYSSVPLIQPGSWISIYGSNLANATSVWNGTFPTSLGNVSVTIDNKPGYLWLVSPGQINLQAPDDTATGPVNVTVTTPNGTATSTVTLTAFGPSFSLLSAKYAAGVILTPNGSGAYGGGAYDLLGPSGGFTFSTRPVRAGETLELYGVGFGPTNPHVAAGAPYSGAAATANPVTVTIGGVSATVLFSGITSAGLYQFNVVVPAGAGTGDQLLLASVAGAQTPTGVYITLQ